MTDVTPTSAKAIVSQAQSSGAPLIRRSLRLRTRSRVVWRVRPRRTPPARWSAPESSAGVTMPGRAYQWPALGGLGRWGVDAPSTGVPFGASAGMGKSGAAPGRLASVPDARSGGLRSCSVWMLSSVKSAKLGSGNR